jgi:hypothetical protein
MLKMFDLFGSGKEKLVGEGFADKIAKQFPPAIENKLIKRGAQRRLEAILETLISDVVLYKKENRIGWFAKAKIGNAFRWRLVEHGYSEQFVEALTQGLVHNLAMK